jgi:hypothetical protein
MSTTVIPTISIQEVYSGGTFGGAASDGTHSEEAIYRGRIQKWIGGTVGGEFSAPDLVGMRVEQVFWALTSGTTPNVSVYLVDDDDVEYLLDAQNLGSGSYVQTNNGFLVPPTFKVRVKSDQAIDAVTSAVGENTGITGDGVSASYNIALVYGRVDPSTVSIAAGSVTFTDPGSDGVLVGAGGGGGAGTIDYLTGAVVINLNTPSDFNAVNALATYDYNEIGRVGIVIGQGWGQPTPSQVGIIGNETYPPTMQRS